ncbi:LANO_0F11276g1_1 [Lachancea nothofagi CBS 11611]|uniref:LANO_0F11276g1_1 n=1 Tax=Lachancea nothofagi CBS 11611 TaxID=1266666 RepID=A0A1G4KAS1_9SACH|nr:LANO_0F11276g1_1 [Lachancea nothofagi CBS 11611]
MMLRSLLSVRKPIQQQPMLRNTVRMIRTFKQEEQPRLRINSLAPNFTAQSTQGKLNLHEYLGNSWGVLFSHPADFTPVCTTELGAFAQLKPEFDQRNVKLIGLSAEEVDKHQSWIKDIEEISGLDKFAFPIIGDASREVAFLYDMVDEEGFKNLNKGVVATIRSVYVIDPSKKVRLIITYPASVGRNSGEVLRVIDALQKGDSKGVVTPINWQPGEDVIIPPTVSDSAAKEKFGDFKTVKPYLRYTKA